MLVYIVLRDGPEIDCFESLELAKKWAKFIGGTVQEENTIDKTTLKEMRKNYRGEL